LAHRDSRTFYLTTSFYEKAVINIKIRKICK
jgi:hypothetical protein